MPTLIVHAANSNILAKSTAIKMQSIIKESKLVSIRLLMLILFLPKNILAIHLVAQYLLRDD